jgi:hypothetical protein
MARPDDEDGDDILDYGRQRSAKACSARFCVHWVRSGDDAPDLKDELNATGAPGRNAVPDYVDLVLREFENVASFEQGTLGWPTPRGDGVKGGGPRDAFDVYIGDVGARGVYGYAAPDDQVTSGPDRYTAYMAIDDDYDTEQFSGVSDPVSALQVTAAHEYLHVLQYATDADVDDWFSEATATWMEDTAYPNSTDWLNYLGDWASSPESTLTSSDREYGSSVFVHWLADTTGLGARGILDSYLSAPRLRQHAVGGIDAALDARGLPRVSSLFGRFAAETAEWRVPGSGFHDRELFRTVSRRTRGADVARRQTLEPGEEARPLMDHLSYLLYDVRPKGAGAIALEVDPPAGVPSSIALVGRTGGIDDGAVEIQRIDLPTGAPGTVVLENPGRYQRVTAVVTNASTAIRANSPNRRYLADQRGYRVTLGRSTGPPVAAPAGPVGAVAPVAPATPILPLVPPAPVLTVGAVLPPLRSTRDAFADALGRRGIGKLTRGFGGVPFRAAGPGRLDVDVYVGEVRVAGGGVTARGPGPVVARVAAGRSTRRIVASRPSRGVTLQVSFKPENGRPRTLERSLTIRR